MTEPAPMTENSTMSLKLVWAFVATGMSVAGSFAWQEAGRVTQQRDIDKLKQDTAEIASMRRDMDSMMFVLCATDDPARQAACRQMEKRK
jgi:hypothetical protein